MIKKSQSSKTGWQRTKLKDIHHTIVVTGESCGAVKYRNKSNLTISRHIISESVIFPGNTYLPD